MASPEELTKLGFEERLQKLGYIKYESPMEIALHETIHVVVLRLEGLGILPIRLEQVGLR